MYTVWPPIIAVYALQLPRISPYKSLAVGLANPANLAICQTALSLTASTA
jgi:hypothetical protein